MNVVLAALVVVASLLPGSEPAAATAVDWRDQAIYMVMTDRFRNGDPENDLDSVPGRADWWQGGDLQGVIDELDYIKGLGMTAIWITPVALQMKGGYHGYWTLDPYKIDPHLGDMAKLQELVRKAHEKSLKVVLDVVPNHLGAGHPWLTDGAHAGWFHPDCPINFSDQTSVENCWLAGLPDLNTENPVVRSYLIDWANWLIDQTGVDGFRVDAARHLSKDFLRAFVSSIRATHPSFWILGEVYSSGYRYQSGFLDAGLDAVTDFQTYDSIRIGLDPRGNLGQLATSPSLAADLGAGCDDARDLYRQPRRRTLCRTRHAGCRDGDAAGGGDRLPVHDAGHAGPLLRHRGRAPRGSRPGRSALDGLDRRQRGRAQPRYPPRAPPAGHAVTSARELHRDPDRTFGRCVREDRATRRFRGCPGQR